MTTTAININRNYRIVTTKYAWCVEKKEKGSWNQIKNYMSLEGLLNEMGDFLTRQGNTDNISKAYKDFNESVRQALKENQELILSMANDSSHPVIRSSNTKIKELAS